MYGVFEDAADHWTSLSQYQAFVADVRAHNGNSAVFTNGRWADFEPIAALNDQLQFPIVSSWSMGELWQQWFSSSVNATLDNARRVVGPIAADQAQYRYLVGHNLLDDATTGYCDKLRLAAQVYRENDPDSPASPMHVWDDMGRWVFDCVQPSVMLTYNYPARLDTTPCSWPTQWITSLRKHIGGMTVPVWLVLQAHSTQEGSTDTTPYHLRYPTVEEIRLQNWIALGEGADGIWWFSYSTQQTWKGLADNPTLYDEVSDLGHRVTAMGTLLQGLEKMADANVPGAYVSVMTDGYLIAANKSCNAANIAISATASLRDVETGVVYAPGQAVPFRGGDGHLLKILP